MIYATSLLTDKLRGWLDTAVKRGGHEWWSIERALSDGRAMIWAADTGCVLTQVTEDDCCEVLLGGGADAKQWIGPMEVAVRGCPAHADVHTYRIVGRRGWMRLFPHWDYAGKDGDLIILESSA